MIQECKSVVAEAEALGLGSRSAGREPPSKVVPWTVRGAHLEPSYYTISFASSVVRYVPPPLAHLRLRCRFNRQMDVEYIPCYLTNLNRVALSKCYLRRPEPSLYDDVGDGLFARHDFVGGRAMRLSSTNHLLPGSSKERVQAHSHDAIRKCFEYCWWHLPPPSGSRDASCVHNMIYHTSAHIKGILKMRKTIARIIRMRGSDTVSIIPGGGAVKCVGADVALLVDNGKNILSEERRMLMPESVSYSVREGSVMNAVIAIQDIRHPKASVIVGHAGEAMQQSDMRPALGLAAWKILQGVTPDSSLTFVADIGDMADRVSAMLGNNAAESGVFFPDFMWRFHSNDAERLVSELSPLYAREGSSVYQLPPAAISFLAVTAPAVLSKSDSAGGVSRLLGLVSADTRRWGRRAKSELAERNSAGANASSWQASLLSGIPSIAAETALSRVFSQHATVPP